MEKYDDWAVYDDRDARNELEDVQKRARPAVYGVKYPQFRVQQEWGPPPPPPEEPRCQVGGCARRGRNGKPVCSDHVQDQPYVKDLMERIRQYETSRK